MKIRLSCTHEAELGYQVKLGSQIWCGACKRLRRVVEIK